jgi:hypothetical protein
LFNDRWDKNLEPGKEILLATDADELLQSVLDFVEGLVEVMQISKPSTSQEAEKMRELLESLDGLEESIQDMRKFVPERAIEVLVLIEGKRNEIEAAMASASLGN